MSEEREDLRPRSVSQALMQYRDLREYLDCYFSVREPLPADVRRRMEVLATWMSAETMAQNLAASLRALWCAVQSGEMSDSDVCDVLWLLAEQAEAVADVAFATEELHGRLHHDDLILAKRKRSASRSGKTAA
ncbi:MAG: hypothetical protein D6775_03730 [Caldilineae bacterium]|nr:MAG: hypothetical protein D6775_03730 [Caldilineae bacterium]